MFYYERENLGNLWLKGKKSEMIRLDLRIVAVNLMDVNRSVTANQFDKLSNFQLHGIISIAFPDLRYLVLKLRAFSQ